jgi:hypothetical protein
MRKELRSYQHWVGEWSGRGHTKKHVPVHVRLSIHPRLTGSVLEFVVESLHVNTNRLVHGVIGLLALDPDDQLRMAVTSTIHGTIVMPMTPEDPGALAFEGLSVTGNRVVISLVEDGEDLLLTAHWKPELPPDVEFVGVTSCRLQRMAVADDE